MLCKIIYFVLFTSCVLGRHVPRFADLDEEDQHLLRAAYDTPSYDHDEYQEDDDLPVGKLDLLKDGLWAIKAKLKELKAFNKAMVANLLSTKLKVKELVATSLITLKKHHHMEDKKKPSYNYQAPAAAYPQYGSQQQYGQQPQQQYSSQPQQQYSAQPQPQQQYNSEYTEPQYAPPQHTHDPYYGH